MTTRRSRIPFRHPLVSAVRPVLEALEGRQLMHGELFAGPSGPVRIDVGNLKNDYVDTGGTTWEIDAGFSGGKVVKSKLKVGGTDADPLYSTRRQGDFAYHIPAAVGKYDLTLAFVDTQKKAGKRLFNVDAEGQRVETNFDIAAAAGAKSALVRRYDVTVADGFLDLAFTGVKNKAVLSAIELTPKPGETPETAPPPTVPISPSNLAAQAVAGPAVNAWWADLSDNETGFELQRSTDGGVTFAPLATGPARGTSYLDSTVSAGATYTYRVRAVNAVGPSGWSNAFTVAVASQQPPPPDPDPTPVDDGVLRVDVGSAAPFTDGAGRVWAADHDVTGGTVSSDPIPDVAGTDQDALFVTRRWGDFDYALPTANGNYTLRLAFTEPVFQTAGSRLFNVDAEGRRVLTNVDLAARGGFQSAVLIDVPVAVTDGALNLSFRGVADNAILSAIELAPSDTPPPPAPTVPAAPSNFNAEAQSATEVLMTWADNATDETGYVVERSQSGGSFVAIATLPAGSTSYTDRTAAASTSYAYRVRATNAVGPSDPSNAKAVTTPAAPQPPEPAPFTRINYTTVAPNPVARVEALRAVVAGRLYVFGGFGPGDVGPITRADYYDPATNHWTQVADLPRRLSHAGTTVDGRDVYFAGGYIGIGPGFTQQFGSKEVWRYNIDTNTYDRMPDLPNALASGGLVVIGRDMHYFSGNDSQRKDAGDHYVLNLDNAAAGWTARAPLPNPRSHVGYATLNGKIYAIGGQHGNDAALVPQGQVDVYDPATDVWTRLADMPKPLNHISGSTLVVGSRILTMGGQTSNDNSVNDVFAYDPATNTWTALNTLPGRRFSGVAGLIDGIIYFTTGSGLTTTWKGTPAA